MGRYEVPALVLLASAGRCGKDRRITSASFWLRMPATLDIRALCLSRIPRLAARV